VRRRKPRDDPHHPIPKPYSQRHAEPACVRWRSLSADDNLPRKAPPVQSAFDWTGLYIGAHAGYGRAPASAVLTDPLLNATATNSASAGMIGGVQAGYNVRLPSGLLFGVEADLTSPNYLISDSIVAVLATPQSEIVEHLDYVGTLRGRLGYASGHWLLFATGGLAYAGERFSNTPASKDT
jgi:high affinity Mn2+ porin